MIIAGQDDTRASKEARRKKRKRNYKKPEDQKIVRGPDTTPWVYIPYGRSSNIVIGYGIMRSHMRKEWFTIYDFYMFQEKRFLMKKLNETFRQLLNCGYLEVRKFKQYTIVEKLGNGQTRLYHISREFCVTPRGMKAISAVAHMNRLKQEREFRKQARTHGQRGAALRWDED